jgi:hypothetical protein
MASPRRALSLFSALFSSSTASSSNPSARQLKDIAIKDLVTVGIFLPVLLIHKWKEEFRLLKSRWPWAALRLAANYRRK